MKRLLLVTVVAIGGVAPAIAAPIQFSGRADARAGFGTNPYLRPGGGRSTAVVGFNVTPTLTRNFATGSTALSGIYSREQYFNNQGNPNTAQILLQHNQNLNPKLSMSASASYTSSSNSLANTGFFSPDITGGTAGIGNTIESLSQNYVDPLTIGARVRRYQGDATFSWRPTARDSVTLNGGFAHGFANRRIGFGSYDFYTGGVSYTRPVNSRMQLGGRMGYTHTDAQSTQTVSSYEPSVLLSYRFSEIWSFDGNIGVTIRRIPSLRQTSTGLGFSANFCGKYTRTGVCVSGSRVTSASGFGGARINTNLGVSLSHQLTSRDTATVNVSYVDSKSIGGLMGLAQQFTQVDSGFDHRIGIRWVVGVDGRLQTRTQDIVSNARGFSVTARVGYLFGRVS